ncbi:hypothetical protein PIB30_042666 [Stylosanthes scabra]|uniref:Uncharacterized protein n=1 Tax=Stylosanthes scabra TaxID=79078 RepID=A0ABU6TEX5_9FABA|nr:hypothetical protein [Stylosanthes scabra]
MPTSLGISEARNWRIGGGDERLNMRTAMELCLDARWRDQGSRVCIELGVQNRELRSRGACEANDSAYGNSGPSGVVSAVGSLFSRGTKANVAAYGSGRGASCHRPGYQKDEQLVEPCIRP